jgi:hypothetical protein
MLSGSFAIRFAVVFGAPELDESASLLDWLDSVPPLLPPTPELEAAFPLLPAPLPAELEAAFPLLPAPLPAESEAAFPLLPALPPAESESAPSLSPV